MHTAKTKSGGASDVGTRHTGGTTCAGTLTVLGAAGASDEAAERFKRKMWRRAVEGRGRLYPSIEKNLKKRCFQTDIGM